MHASSYKELGTNKSTASERENSERTTQHTIQIANESTVSRDNCISYRRDHCQRATLRHAGCPRVHRRLRAVDGDTRRIVDQFARLGIRIGIRIGRRVEIRHEQQV